LKNNYSIRLNSRICDQPAGTSSAPDLALPLWSKRPPTEYSHYRYSHSLIF